MDFMDFQFRKNVIVIKINLQCKCLKLHNIT